MRDLSVSMNERSYSSKFFWMSGVDSKLDGLSYDLLLRGGGGGFTLVSCLGIDKLLLWMGIVDLTDSFHSMLDDGSDESKELFPLSRLDNPR